MKVRFIEDGNVSGWLRTMFVVIGVMLIILPTKLMEASWLCFCLLLSGLVLMAVEGFAARAYARD